MNAIMRAISARPAIRFSPLAGILVMRRDRPRRPGASGPAVSVPLRGFWYSDTLLPGLSSGQISCFSPLTGILVRRLCLPVPAPRLGSQAIFSNLGLFSPFSLTRVKNKNQPVSFIRFVTPFVAIFEIFKPTGFLTLK